MKQHIIQLIGIVGLAVSCIGDAGGQSKPDRSAVSEELRAYLDRNDLWASWEVARRRFECPTKEIGTTGAESSVIRQQGSVLTPQDSAKMLYYIQKGYTLPYTEFSPPAIDFALEERAEAYQKRIARDPEYFKKYELNVLNVLYRFPDSLRRRDKIIVTDITASMAPYAEQVLLWQRMFLEKEGRAQFVFFNDGDDQIEDQKPIGATGGIYRAGGGADSLQSIIAQMQRGMRAGGGGEAPENDLEALLVAQSFWDSTRQEIILIADPKSPVRDLELIHLLQKNARVRVVLCGFKHFSGGLSGYVPMDYYLIAYLTHGSLHALEGDLWAKDLDVLLENKVAYIGGKPYLVKDRTVQPISKSDADFLHLEYKKRDQ